MERSWHPLRADFTVFAVFKKVKVLCSRIAIFPHNCRKTGVRWGGIDMPRYSSGAAVDRRSFEVRLHRTAAPSFFQPPRSGGSCGGRIVNPRGLCLFMIAAEATPGGALTLRTEADCWLSRRTRGGWSIRLVSAGWRVWLGFGFSRGHANCLIF